MNPTDHQQPSCEKDIIVKHSQSENKKLHDEMKAVQYSQVYASDNGTSLKRKDSGDDSSLIKRLRTSYAPNENVLTASEAENNEPHNSDLQQQLDKLSQENNALIEENTDLKDQLDESKQKFADLSESAGNILKYNDDLKAERVNLQTQLANSNVADIQVQLKKINRQNFELSKKISDAAQQHNGIVEYFAIQRKSMMSAKRFEDALEFYLKAIAIEENGQKDAKKLGLYWCDVALCWGVGMAKYEKALEAIKNATVFDPSNSEFCYIKGIYLKQLGNRTEAIESLKQAIHLNPDHENAKSLLLNLENDTWSVTVFV